MENCLFISCCSQKSKNSSKVNSPPWLDLRHLIFQSDSFSTNTLKALNFWNASYLCFIRPIQHILEKSSMNRIKYHSQWGKFFLDGPHKSIWTSSRGLLADPSFSMKWTLVFLPIWHGFHIVFLGMLIFGRLQTTLNVDAFLIWENLRCPNLLCQN